jgi:hypothetical protein
LWREKNKIKMIEHLAEHLCYKANQPSNKNDFFYEIAGAYNVGPVVRYFEKLIKFQIKLN